MGWEGVALAAVVMVALVLVIIAVASVLSDGK